MGFLLIVLVIIFALFIFVKFKKIKRGQKLNEFSEIVASKGVIIDRKIVGKNLGNAILIDTKRKRWFFLDADKSEPMEFYNSDLVDFELYEDNKIMVSKNYGSYEFKTRKIGNFLDIFGIKHNAHNDEGYCNSIYLKIITNQGTLKLDFLWGKTERATREYDMAASNANRAVRYLRDIIKNP